MGVTGFDRATSIEVDSTVATPLKEETKLNANDERFLMAA